MALRPIQDRALCARRPERGHFGPHGALAAALDLASARLHQDREIPAEQLGAAPAEPAQAVAGRLDLLAVVEDVGNVAYRLGHAGRQPQLYRDAGLHVGGPAAVEPLLPRRRVALTAGREVAGHGHGVDVPGQDDPLRAAQVRAGHDGVSVPQHTEVGQRAQRGFDHVGEVAFLAAHRGDVDDARGERGRVGGQIQFHPRSLTARAGNARPYRNRARPGQFRGSRPRWRGAGLRLVGQARDGQTDRMTSSVAYTESPAPSFLFDLDGTLIDSVYQHVIAWRAALAGMGIDLSVWRIHRRIGMSGGLFVSALLRETGLSLSPEDIERLQRAHGDEYRAQMDSVLPLPGAADLLNSLTERGIKWAIATSGNAVTARPALKLLGLPEHTPMVTRDQVHHAKPDPDLFLAAAALLDVDPAQAMVVGDSVWDLLAARRAGALGVGLLSGGYGREELERSGAFRVYNDPADLLTRLDELGVRGYVD